MPSLRRDVLWTFAGIGVFAVGQWITIIAMSKLGTASMVGDWTLALAITAPIFIFCQLKLRAVQATDLQDEHAWGEYVALRIAGVVAAFAIVGSVVALRYRDETGLAIMAIALSRGFDSASDLIYGLLQRSDEMRTLAISQIARGTTAVIASVTVLEATGSIVAIALANAGSYALWLIWDVRQARRVLAGAPIGPVWNGPRVRALLWRVVPLGLVTAIGSLQVNIPRYFLDAYDTRAEVGIFGSLSALLAFGVIAINALTNAVLPRLARHVVAKDWTAFRHDVRRLMLVGLAMGLTGVAGAALIGKPVLRLLYTEEYAAHVDTLVLLSIVGTLTWTYVFLGTSLDALRFYAIQPWIHGTSSLVIAIAALIIVPGHGMSGAAVAMLIGYAVEAVLYLTAVTSRIRSLEAASTRP